MLLERSLRSDQVETSLEILSLEQDPNDGLGSVCLKVSGPLQLPPFNGSGGKILTALHVTCKSKNEDTMRLYKILSYVRSGPGCLCKSVRIFCLVCIVMCPWQ